ncbi:MAG: hypothetical protein IH591_06325, partial [Bacteroidales bacterium]|nr:hypothetical protein [Bacteroidales bacterium]
IATDGEFVYLLSVYENCIYVVDVETEEELAVIGGSKSAEYKFGALASVQTDHNGNLLVFDSNDNSLYRFTRDGALFTLSATESYSTPGQLCPSKDGNIYTTDPVMNSVRIDHMNGTPLAVINCSNAVSAAEVIGTDTVGNIYLRVTESDEMAQYGGIVTARVVSPEGVQQFALQLMQWTNGPMERNLVVDGGGSIFEAFFDGSPDDETNPPTRFFIRRHK